MAKDFKDKTQDDYARRLENVMRELPVFCKTFFSGKRALSKTTEALYAYDLRTFFLYLAENNSYFKEKIKLSYEDGEVRILENNLLLDDLKVLSSDDIDEFAHDLEKIKKNSKYTIEHYLSSISSLYKFFVKRRQLDANPVDYVEREKVVQKEVVRLSLDDKNDFLSAIESGEGLTKKQLQFHKRNKERDYCIYKMFLSTGMRVSELAGIDLDDIDLNKKSIKIIRKGGKTQRIFFSNSCYDALVEYLNVRNSVFKPLDSERALFVGPSGARLSVRAIQNLTRKYVETALPGKNENITTHKLRSTYASEVLQKTHDIKRVSKALGHANVTTTERYADYLDDELEEIRNITDD